MEVKWDNWNSFRSVDKNEVFHLIPMLNARMSSFSVIGINSD